MTAKKLTRMKNTTLTILFIVMLLSCKKQENKAVNYPVNIPFITVAKGSNCSYFSKYPTGNNSIITNPTVWAITLSKLDSLASPTNPDIKIRTVDFNSNQLIFVIDTVRYEGGWTKDIISIKEYQNHIEIAVDNIEKSNDATEVRQPFHIVQIPKQSKPIVFN